MVTGSDGFVRVVAFVIVSASTVSRFVSALIKLYSSCISIASRLCYVVCLHVVYNSRISCLS